MTLITIDRGLLAEIAMLAQTHALELELVRAEARRGGSPRTYLEAAEEAQRASDAVTLVRALLAADASRALVVDGHVGASRS